MKIYEIVNEGLLDTLKFIGRAAYSAAGGQIDRNSPSITRANLEYVRKQLASELYRQFVGSLIKQGALTRSGKLLDPNKSADIVTMAVQFLKQAYRSYIVAQNKLIELDQTIDNVASKTTFNELRVFFNEINLKYLTMLQDVEATVSADRRKIINSLAQGINNFPKKFRQLIKQYLNDLSSQSKTNIIVPRSNTPVFTKAVEDGNENISATLTTLYDETLNAIIGLQLTDNLYAEFSRLISD